VAIAPRSSWLTYGENEAADVLQTISQNGRMEHVLVRGATIEAEMSKMFEVRRPWLGLTDEQAGERRNLFS